MGSIIAIVVIIGGISLYHSFAMYEEKQTFDVLKGTVPDFSNNGDIILAYTIDDVPQSGNFPAKESGLYGKVAKCENDASATWDNESWGLTNIVPGENKKVVCTIAFRYLFSSYLIKLAQENVNVTESGLLIQNHEQTVQTGDNAITDYRYVGPEPDNFVCLEEDGNCNDEDKLYRIVGIIPTQKDASGSYELRVKLVKYRAYVGNSAKETSNTLSGKGYYWAGTVSNNLNNWLNSSLNTQILNNEYWQSIESYQNYIEKAKWYLGGSDATTFKNYYVAERSNTGGGAVPGTINTITNVALIYASDYGYSTSGGTTYNRETCLSNISYSSTNQNYMWGYFDAGGNLSMAGECVKNTWFYVNEEECILTPSKTSSTNVLAISLNGGIWGKALEYEPNIRAVKPTFYLSNKVQYKSGNGSKENPYQIRL